MRRSKFRWSFDCAFLAMVSVTLWSAPAASSRRFEVTASFTATRMPASSAVLALAERYHMNVALPESFEGFVTVSLCQR